MRLFRKSTLVAVATSITLALAASAAQASIRVDNTSPRTGTGISATISPPTFSKPVTHAALAQCNTTSGDARQWAKRCNDTQPNRYVRPTTVPGRTFTWRIVVDAGFKDADFSGQQPPGTSTNCKSAPGTDQCSAVVSYYNLPPGGTAPKDLVFLGAEKANITLRR